MPDILPTADTLQTLSLMRQGHWWQLEPPPPGFWQDLRRVLRGARQGADPIGIGTLAAAGIIGRPTAVAALPFHRDALARLCRCSPSQFCRDRLAYHADWLLSLLTGQQGPLVSVIIPVFNRADTISEAVACCFEQTYPNIEIVVIDDGSSENIAAVLPPQGNRLRLLRQETNRGAGVARNLGITHARGSLLHFLDADDLLEPDAIARKIQALQAIPDADLVFSGARQTGLGEHERNKQLRFLDPPTGDEHCPTTDLLAVAATGYPFLTSTVLLPRHLLREIGPFDPVLRRHQDTDLFFRLALHGIKAVGITGWPTHRRVGGRSLSAALPPARYTARLRARCLVHLAATPQHWPRYSPEVLAEIMQPELFEALALDREAELPRYRRAVFHALRRMCGQSADHAATALQLQEQLRRCLDRLQQECPRLIATALYRDLASLLDP